MSTITFDTHKFIKDLQASGVPEAQAEAFVRSQQEILAQVMDNTLATKSDALKLERRIDAVDSQLREMKAELNGKLTLNHWMLAAILGVAIANFAKQFF
ncbi:MAG TPA: coiled-coil domain-containing protein [Rhodocyclaceae bacterium]|nr:coiled-coil domain-containing protein [Rhodocyclaceae bacterium]